MAMGTPSYKQIAQEFGWGSDTKRLKVWLNSQRVQGSYRRFTQFSPSAIASSQGSKVRKGPNDEAIIVEVVSILSKDPMRYILNAGNEQLRRKWTESEYYIWFIVEVVIANTGPDTIWAHKTSRQNKALARHALRALHLLRHLDTKKTEEKAEKRAEKKAERKAKKAADQEFLTSDDPLWWELAGNLDLFEPNEDLTDLESEHQPEEFIEDFDMGEDPESIMCPDQLDRPADE